MTDTSSQSVSYVRETMLAESAPPVTEIGVVRWVRENLFSSWMNAILTVISIYVVYWILSHVGPWLLGGIWDAGSLSECREIRDKTVGSDHGVACFAVISARWHQLLFGYYPSELYWRPILALIIFLVGLIPVLFAGASRKLLYVSAAAPFVCFWLLWGGSIWLPISAALGFAVGYFAYKPIVAAISPLAGIIAAIVLPLVYWLFAAGPLYGALDSILPIGIQFVESRAFGGFMLSVVIGLSAIILSLPLGILLALGRQSDLFIIKTSSVIFIEVIRGVPLIVWLFTAQLLLNYFLPPGSNFDLTLRVIIMVTLFSAAYIAEVVRGGLAALPKGGIASAIRATTEWNGIYWELFIFIGVMFFIACFSMGRYSLYLERLLQRENR